MLPLYEKINSLCVEAGINITEMCRSAGVPRSALSDYKTGRKKTISLKNLEKIADFFAISLDTLTGRKQEKTPTPVSESGRNIVRMAGRDGSYVERHLTDEQLAAIKFMVEQLPDADDL